jgi:regulatory factor X
LKLFLEFVLCSTDGFFPLTFVISDWIALNVLRSVALSTNSVAASVEPMMQQQFFTLSPMAGQESFGHMEIRPSQPVMNHTPTTSNMLAALQHEPFHGGHIDPSAHFAADYGPMSYMDTANTGDDGLPNPAGLFSDYVSGSQGPFEVATGYTSQDIPIGNTDAPTQSDGGKDAGQVKTEPAA